MHPMLNTAVKAARKAGSIINIAGIGILEGAANRSEISLGGRSDSKKSGYTWGLKNQERQNSLEFEQDYSARR